MHRDMYQNIEGTLTLTVDAWENAGLTWDQFKNDSKRGFLKIFRRGINGNTLIDVRSIKRHDRIKVLENAYGKIDKTRTKSIFEVTFDQEAQALFIGYKKLDGSPLDPDRIVEYTNKASIFKGIKKGFDQNVAGRARVGNRIKLGEFWKDALIYYNQLAVGTETEEAMFPAPAYSNARSFERAFKDYVNSGCDCLSLIHKNEGNDSARKVSADAEKLMLAIWRTHDKPFVHTVYKRYIEFIEGDKILFDKETGEQFNPADFRHKGRAMKISEATVWNYLKDVVNKTSVFADRNGNFDYVNKYRPKQKRKIGQFSLSKIYLLYCSPL